MITFPDWAPRALVEQLERSIAYREKHDSHDPDQIVAGTIREERFSHLSSDAVERFRASLYRNSLFLPKDEEIRLLQRVLTDLRMKSVWSSLQRRQKSETDYWHFWSLCSTAIIEWRGEQKLSLKEHRQHFQEIWEHAAALQSLLDDSRQFHLYSTNSLIKDSTIEWLIDTLDAGTFGDRTKDVEYARFCLSDVVPQMFLVLQDIAEKAKKFSEESPLVLKPRSEQAPVHYFVRRLSAYLREYYGQPLHDVVGATASVLLDADIDSDLVRKLVVQ